MRAGKVSFFAENSTTAYACMGFLFPHGGRFFGPRDSPQHIRKEENSVLSSSISKAEDADGWSGTGDRTLMFVPVAGPAPVHHVARSLSSGLGPQRSSPRQDAMPPSGGVACAMSLGAARRPRNPQSIPEPVDRCSSDAAGKIVSTGRSRPPGNWIGAPPGAPPPPPPPPPPGAAVGCSSCPSGSTYCS